MSDDSQPVVVLYSAIVVVVVVHNDVPLQVMTSELTIGWCTEQLNKALDMMNNAVTSGHSQPGARENVAYLASTERRRDFESLPASAVSAQDVRYNNLL